MGGVKRQAQRGQGFFAATCHCAGSTVVVVQVVVGQCVGQQARDNIGYSTPGLVV